MLYDIATIGEPLYELNEVADRHFVPGFGGDTSNVAIAAARLGAKVAIISKLGRDQFGHAIRDMWHCEGVDATAVGEHATAQTGLYIVSHDKGGHRFTYYRTGSAASRLTSREIPRRIVCWSRFLHVSSISQGISASAADAVDFAIAAAPRKDVSVSYDTNFRPQLWRKKDVRSVILRTAGRADLVKTSLEDIALLFGMTDLEAISRRFLGLGAKSRCHNARSQRCTFGNAVAFGSDPALRGRSLGCNRRGRYFYGCVTR